MVQYLTLGDFLGIAECIDSAFSAEVLLANDEIVARARTALYAPCSLDEQGNDVFPDLETKAAILAFTFIRERPLPTKNIVLAHECMKEFCARNGVYFDRGQSNRNPVEIWANIADGNTGALEALVLWVRECI